MGRSETFSDLTDVQTRLVLLPRVEEEGVGAVVASFFVPPPKRTSGSTSEDEDTSSRTQPRCCSAR